MCASAKFSHFKKRISNIFKCYPTKNIETPLQYYHNILYSMPATRQPVLIVSFATRDAEQFLTPLRFPLQLIALT